MSERLARILLGVVTGCVLVVPFVVDLPRDSSGRFWSDGATYYAMASSLAEDGDLRYEARDLERIRSVYPGGPQGLFLKRTGLEPRLGGLLATMLGTMMLLSQPPVFRPSTCPIRWAYSR